MGAWTRYEGVLEIVTRQSQSSAAFVFGDNAIAPRQTRRALAARPLLKEGTCGTGIAHDGERHVYYGNIRKWRAPMMS
jgi:hypothetical protein